MPGSLRVMALNGSISVFFVGVLVIFWFQWIVLFLFFVNRCADVVE